MTINTSPKLGFQLPTDGDTSWGSAIRGNFTEIENILPGYMFMQDTANTTGLTFALKAGNLKVSATVASYAGGTVTLTASATNYVEAYIDSSNKAQVVVNTSAFTVGRVPLYEVVTGASTITTTTDVRALLSAESSTNSFIDQFSQDAATTSGLTYGYNAGTVANDNVVTTVAAGTVALTDKAINYVELDPIGTVSANTTSFTSGRIPLAKVAVDASGAWAASTAESVGNTVSPSTANGFAYKATTAGITGLTEPTWPTALGSTVNDDAGAATWVASNTYAANARALPSTQNGFYYEGDVANKSAPTEPTWPTTAGQTVVDETGFASWAASTPYSAGGDVTPTALNGFYYEVTTAGTSGTTEPTWPTTEGATVTDGSVTWTAHKAITWTAKGIITWETVAKITGVTDDRTWARAGGGGGTSGNATQIQGYNVPVPTSANDGQALEWDNTNKVWKYGSGGSSSVKNSLVAQVDVSAATTSVAFNNLSAVADGGYVLEVDIVNGTTSNADFVAYINGDTTGTNYSCEEIRAQGTAVSSSSPTGPRIAFIMGSGSVQTSAQISFGGNAVTTSSDYYRNDQSAIVNTSKYSVSISDITSITVSSSIANAIGAGSKLCLYRRKT